MSDQTHDTPNPDAGIFAAPDHDTVKAQIETILDLDEVLSSARRVERTAYINLRADLEARYNQVLADLAALVDADGQLVNENPDSSLAEASQAADLREEATELRREMKAATRAVKFRAMDSDAWEEFEASHRGKNGELKNQRAYENALVAACAIAPTLTVDGFEKLRKQLGQSQIVKLYNEAYYCNAKGGLDVPKSPSYLAAPKPQE